MPEDIAAPTNPNSDQDRSNSASALAWNQNIHRAIVICATLQIGCFFLPWANILIGRLSGFQIQELENPQFKLVWFVPLTAIGALLGGLSKTGVRLTAQLAGVTPFLLLFYFTFQMGTDLFQILEFGTYFSLLLGIVLFFLPRFLKKRQP